MRYYLNINHAIQITLEKLLHSGEKVKTGTWQAIDKYQEEEMLVLRNEFFTVPTDTSLHNIGADIPWVEEHFKERVGGRPTNPGESYKRWPYNVFKEGNDPYKDGTKFSHTYQERFWPKNAGLYTDEELYNPKYMGPIYTPNKGIRYDLGDLNDVIKQLKDNPLTRQSYLPIFFPEDTGAVHKQRVPCTLGYYFWVEDNKLNCNYIIRSCDAYRHLRNDIYLTLKLVQYIADRINLHYGDLNFMCFNLHIFINNIYALNKKEKRI